MGTMDIDENAPVITREEILIDAPLSTVWGLHTDISSWSEWLPDIDSSTIEGLLEVGTTFRWQTFGLSIESTIREIEPPRRIVWSGPAQGIVSDAPIQRRSRTITLYEVTAAVCGTITLERRCYRHLHIYRPSKRHFAHDGDTPGDRGGADSRWDRTLHRRPERN
jgi:hypothetical protein